MSTTSTRQTVVLPPLPQIDDAFIPAWRFTRHAMAITVVIVGALVVICAVGAAVIPLHQTVSGDGSIEPLTVTALRPADGGVLERLSVSPGQVIQAGDVVGQFETATAVATARDVASQLDEAHLDLERLRRSVDIDQMRSSTARTTAEAHVTRARSQLIQRMVEYGVKGDPDSVAASSPGRGHVVLDAASADLIAAQAEVASARVDADFRSLTDNDIARKRLEIQRLQQQLVDAESKVKRHLLRSVVSGTVISEQLDQLVGMYFNPGQSVLEVADLAHWRASVTLSEQDVHEVRPGDTAQVELPAFSTQPVDRVLGVVESVAWQPPATPSGNIAGATYRVLVALPADGLKTFGVNALRKGFVAHVTVVTRSGSALSLALGAARDRLRGVIR